MDYSRIRNASVRDIISALQHDGFTLARQKGSHRHYKHPDGRRVTVTFHHASDTIPLGTLRKMIEMEAKWDESDLKRLGLF